MNEDEAARAQELYDTCRNRSTEQEEIGEVSCCKNTLRMAHVCFRRNIEDLQPKHCLNCKYYKDKR